jgi:hypothetical protein
VALGGFSLHLHFLFHFRTTLNHPSFHTLSPPPLLNSTLLPAKMKSVETQPPIKDNNDLRRDVPAAAAVPSNYSPAMSYILSLIPLLNNSPLPVEMKPATGDNEDLRRDAPAAMAAPSNYFPSRIPAEIRNKIYEFVLRDAMASAHRHPVERSLITCRRLYGVNRQIRDEFASMVPLIVHLDKIPATLLIFFPPHCLSGHCSHSKHATCTTKVRIILPNRILGPRDLTDILRTKFNTRDLSIKFSIEVPRFCRDFQEGFYVCRLFHKVFGSPSAVLLAVFGSGALKSITLIPPPYTRRDDPWTLRLGLRRSPSWLSKKDRDLVIGCLTHLQQESTTFLVNARVCASVQDKKGAVWGEWVECEETNRLVRNY